MTTTGKHTAGPRKDYEPINCLVTNLSIQGNHLVEISGYMNALWHMRVLDDHRMPSRIADARIAIKKASDALDAYEAALSKAEGGAT